MRHTIAILVAAIAPGAMFASMLLSGCGEAQADAETVELFPKDYHSLLPMLPRAETHVAAGEVTGEAPIQPIAFPHDRHVQIDGIDCQYCHSAARNSIHAGVPPLQTCMGCHRYVLKDSPEIKLLTAYWERGEPLPWKKVHDLPDFVYFSHMRHTRAGVDCTECHGQVQLMAGVRKPERKSGASHPTEPSGHEAPAAGHEAAAAAEAPHDPQTAAEAAEMLGPVHNTMIREASLQMGWCLDCHATHPSIDQNYGEAADLRRAELKDCWTCHK